ncbi:MAG: hypothetical protein IJM15_02195 [Erysipelotrichaceae bacterium]|nr:hypothetical protein [Erysipelotrichaceae bacterium]
MASIAYISDSNMLEYHRLNGNKTIVFWRISSKKFSDFTAGDLLFFLSKDQQQSRRNEKGIVGCGCYMGNSSHSINQMWKKYRDATGYGSLKALREAIIKNNKSEEEPAKVNCLKLQHVVFFQSPIYLSDVGMKISNSLESFTYLDKNGGTITLTLLDLASKVGPDSWSSALNDYDFFNQQILFYKLTTVFNQNNIATNYKNSKLTNKVIKKYPDLMWLNRQRQSFLLIGKENRVCYLFSSSQKTQNEKFYETIGELDYVRSLIDDPDLKYTVITGNALSEAQKKYLIRKNIYLEELSD